MSSSFMVRSNQNKLFLGRPLMKELVGYGRIEEAGNFPTKVRLYEQSSFVV